MFSPPELVFVIAQAASFLVLNSAFPRMSIKAGKMLACMTAWICCLLPAVMLEMVQQASFRTLSLDALRRVNRQGSTEQFRIT